MDLQHSSMSHNSSIKNLVICSDRRISDTLYSRGIWFGQSPLKSTEAVFMLQIVLVFVTCRGLHFLFRPIKLPKFICSIMGGIILGPSVLGRNKTILDSIFPLDQIFMLSVIATTGGVCFIFITAVKTDINTIRKSSRKIWIIGTMSWIAPSISNFFYHRLSKFLRGFSAVANITLVTCASSTTYVPVIVQALDELNILHSELGQLATSASLVNQLFGLILTSITVVSTNDFDTSLSVVSLTSVVVMVLFIIFVIRPVILWFTRKIPEGELVPETHIIGIILATLLIGVVSDMLGATFLVGVLLMGLIIPDGPPLGSTLTHKFELIVSELFMPIFFAQIGYNTNVFLIGDWKAFAVLHFIVLMGYLAKAGSILVVSQFFHVRFRNACVLGLIFNIWGVVDLGVLLHWLSRDVLNGESYTSLVLSNLALTAITTLIIQYLYKPQRLVRSPCDKKSVRTLQTTCQDSELRVLVCIHDESNVHSIISLLEASNPSVQSPLCIYLIHLIQFIGREIPLLVPYKRYNKRIKRDSSSHIMCAFTNYSKNSNGPVKLQPYTMIAPYRTMDDSICNLARDKHVPLMILPIQRGQHVDPIKANEVRKYTERMQEQAPCTLGILVENSSSIRKDLTMFSCNIQVLFFGGCDDREALALANRMSGNPNVRITFCRINLKNCRKDAEKTEKLLDDELVNDFKEKTKNNPSVICHEMEAKDSYIEIISLIKSLDRNNDLVIAGKRRARNVGFEEEMAEWMELPELGGIGDIFASLSEINGCKMSVLVLQQQGIESAELHQDSIKSSDCKNDKLGIC